MNILSSINNITFDGYLDTEVYHLANAKEYATLPSGIIVGRKFLTNLIKNYKTVKAAKDLDLDKSYEEHFKDHCEALALNDSFDEILSVNIIAKSNNLKQGLYLNIRGYNNILLALCDILKKHDSLFFVIKPGFETKMCLEVFEEKDFFSVDAYKGEPDVFGIIKKANYLLSKEYLNIETTTEQKQTIYLKQSQYSNSLRKVNIYDEEINFNLSLIEEGARTLKRLRKEGKLGKALFLYDGKKLYLTRLLYTEDEPETFREENEAEDKVIDFDSLETYDVKQSNTSNDDNGDDVWDDFDTSKKEVEEEDVEELTKDFEEYSFFADEKSSVFDDQTNISTGDLDDINEESVDVSFSSNKVKTKEEFGSLFSNEPQEEETQEEEKETDEASEEEFMIDDNIISELGQSLNDDEDVVESEFIFSDNTVDFKDEVENYIRKEYNHYFGTFPQNIKIAINRLEDELEHAQLLRKAYFEKPLNDEEQSVLKEILRWD